MGAGQQGVVWAVRPGVVGGVAARLRLRSELRPSLRLRRPATPLEYRCQGDISKSVNRVTFLFRYNMPRPSILDGVRPCFLAVLYSSILSQPRRQFPF